jgi:hypothetical protein
VAQNLIVKPITAHERSDSEIAGAIQRSLEWDACVPESVTVMVNCGSVTLVGRAVWEYESDAAERAVRHLKGVVGVRNGITLEPETQPAQVEGAQKLECKGNVSAHHVFSESLGIRNGLRWAGWTQPSGFSARECACGPTCTRHFGRT